MHVERDTIIAACSMAPKEIFPQRHCGLSVCSLSCAAIQHSKRWLKIYWVLTMEKSLCPEMEETTLVESEHSDESIDLPMEGDADLSIQVKQKNGN
jgi:hypothetical protein